MPTPDAERSAVWKEARNILCIRLDSMGDVLMSTPAIRAIRQSGRGRRITLMTSPEGAGIAALMPEIDEVMAYDAPWMKATTRREDSERDAGLIQLLRSRRFDAAVIFTTYSQSPLPAAMLCYLADIPLRLGTCHENPYQLLTDWVPDMEPEQMINHEVRRQMDLVGAVGCHTQDLRLSLQVPPEAASRVDALLWQLHVGHGQRWIVVHVGASAASRRYPPDLFAQVVRELYMSLDLQMLFTGVEAEQPLIGYIRGLSGVPSISLAGQLSLSETAALIQRAPLLLSNNTGPAHIAAAVGTPIVDLYALTNPQHTPWGVPQRVLYHDVPCRFCYKSVCPEGHHNCLCAVDPEVVVTAVADLLDEVHQYGHRFIESRPITAVT